MDGREHLLEVKVALSVPEALDVINEHEIEKTVRFSVYWYIFLYLNYYYLNFVVLWYCSIEILRLARLDHFLSYINIVKLYS